MNINYQYLDIKLKDISSEDTVTIRFKPLLQNQITHRWLEVLEMSTQLYSIDNPSRFYDFNPNNQEVTFALNKLNSDIEIINNHRHLIEKSITDINDQETLNYLHSIFEIHHGHLDKQSKSEYWLEAPKEVRQALADLNIDVHRCEHIRRRKDKQSPRVVITWYGLPKTHHIFDEDYELFNNEYKFGTIYLGYCEIGKTLHDMQRDDELGEYSHATDEALKPYHFFSGDMHIKFYDVDKEQAKIEENLMWEYFDKHKEYFESKGYEKYSKYLNIGMLPVAEIETDKPKEEILELIKTHQHIEDVSIIY